jgi:mannosyltransferase
VSVGTIAPGARRPSARPRTERVRDLVSTREVVLVTALTLLAAALRFVRIGHQGFWFDEANTALLVQFSPGKMIGLIPQSESTPPLYYCVAWVWARVFGYGEAGLRSLSALAGVLTVPVAFAAGRKLISVRTGLFAAALASCDPLLIWYSQEARSYELLVLLTSASLLAFAYVRAEPTPRAVAGWVIAAVLALATHYYALLAIVPQALWLAVIHRRRRPVQAGIAVVAACGLALIPLAISQNGTGHASWIGPIPLGPRLAQVIPQFLTGTGAPAQEVLVRIDEAMVIVALLLLALRSDPLERRSALVAAALAVGGLLLGLVLVAVGIDDLITRNVIALWLPAALLVAGGLGARRAGVLGLAVAAVLCATGIIAAVGVAADRNLQRPDWRAVARVLGTRPAPGVGGRAILVQHYRDLLPLSLYLPGLKFWRSQAAEPVRELDVVSISAPGVPLCWWGAACNLVPSRMQASYPVPGFRELWLRHVYQFTIMRLVSSSGAPVRLTQRMVSRALTATTLPRDELLIQR